MSRVEQYSRLRIAVLIKRFLRTGGAEKYAMEVVRRLALDHDVHVFSHEWSYEGPEPITFHRIPRLCVKPAWANQLVFSYLTRRAVGPDFDIVHSFEKVAYCDVMTVQSPCFGNPSAGEKTLWKRMRNGVRLVMSPRKLAWRWLEKRQFSRSGAKVVIAVSEQVKRNVQAHYLLPDERFRLAYTGVSLPERTVSHPHEDPISLRTQLGLAPGALVVLFVGTEFKRKGLDALLQGFALLPRSRFTLLVAGGGGGRLAYYKDLAERLQLSREVKFIGLVSDVERLYSIADFYVLPTLSDPCPLAPLEAMAAGVATVMSSSEFNGSAELIKNGEALILSDPNDPQEIATVLLKLTDGQFRTTQAQKGRQLVRQLTWDKTAADTLSAYRDVIRMRAVCGARCNSSLR